ncbi:MAG TPA: Holliday junction branch migration protein RuvA [Candidatus Bathyarchaeia archaeon]|nr:Holliday junction branch migration protein RuvA [Candidatus Bathyarchaeia archaeon]
MIDSLWGKIIAIEKQKIVVQTGAFALSLGVAREYDFALQQDMHIYIYFHWNEEQGPSLFGFLSPLDRTIFSLTMNCSGIGPKIALAILEQLGTELFLDAVSKEDHKALSKVSGIGPKKAEQMIVHLKYKVHALLTNENIVTPSGNTRVWQEVSQALEALHYSRGEITAAMKVLRKEQLPDIPFDKLLRKALSVLAK